MAASAFSFPDLRKCGSSAGKSLGGGGDVSVYRMLYSGGSMDLSVPEKADAGRAGGVLC